MRSDTASCLTPLPAARTLATRGGTMALTWFGGSREVGLAELIAQRKYAKAIELLRAQYQEGSRDPRLRLQLADVMAAAGRGSEAVPIYLSLADEFARDGFAGKAIAVFKKV